MAAKDQPRSAGPGRFFTGVVWAVLLLGVWLWGRELTDGAGGYALGDVSAAGRHLADGPPLPAPHDPLAEASEPLRLDIDAIGVHARVIPRGLDRTGAVAPPPYSEPGVVGWYRKGPTPGEEGATVLVGHVDTDKRRAVFYPLSSAEPGSRVEITRADGTVAEFTVTRTDVISRKGFDASEVYGPRQPDRAELRLITCGGTFDRESRTYTSNVVVSAYLTGTRQA